MILCLGKSVFLSLCEGPSNKRCRIDVERSKLCIVEALLLLYMGIIQEPVFWSAGKHNNIMEGAFYLCTERAFKREKNDVRNPYTCP
jgi:hypothetical protein